VRDDAGSRDGRTTAVDMRLRRMRLTIAELMAAVVYAAVLIWLLGDGHAVPSVGMAWFAVAFVCWASVRGRRRPAAICFGASVIAANSSVAPLCVYYQGWALTVLYIGLLGGMPMIFGFGAAWAGVAMHRDIDHGRSPSASWPPLLAIVLALSIAMTPLDVVAAAGGVPHLQARLGTAGRPGRRRQVSPLPNPGRTVSHRPLRDGPRQWQRRLNHRPET
jgi:hypothetical protein